VKRQDVLPSAVRWVRVPYDDEIRVVYLELDAANRLIREVGLDEAGAVVHRCPDDRFVFGDYGLDYPPSLDEAIDIPFEEFAEQWERPATPPLHRRDLMSDAKSCGGCLVLIVALAVGVVAIGDLFQSVTAQRVDTFGSAAARLVLAGAVIWIVAMRAAPRDRGSSG